MINFKVGDRVEHWEGELSGTIVAIDSYIGNHDEYTVAWDNGVTSNEWPIIALRPVLESRSNGTKKGEELVRRSDIQQRKEAMNLTARQLSGEHIGKTVTMADPDTGEIVTTILTAISHDHLGVRVNWSSKTFPRHRTTDLDNYTPITIQEEQ